MASKVCGRRIHRLPRAIGMGLLVLLGLVAGWSAVYTYETAAADYVLRFQTEFRWKASPVDRPSTDSIGYTQWQITG